MPVTKIEALLLSSREPVIELYTLERYMPGWDNINIHVGEILCASVHHIHLSQDRSKDRDTLACIKGKGFFLQLCDCSLFNNRAMWS